MDKAKAIASVRKQLTEGNIEEALELLIQNLEPERQSLRDLNNRALQAKAQLEKIQKDEQDGVISFENSKVSYNQITRQIIHLVDEWEDPSTVSPSPTPLRKSKFHPKMYLVAAVLVAFTGLIIWQLITRGNKDGTIHATDNCPDLAASSFSIMVLPFTPLHDPNATDSPHRPLATRLDRFKREYSGTYQTEVFSKDEPTPTTDEQAVNSAEDCRAELVIWGEYERLIPVDKRTIVTTNYKYLSAAENFEFTMLSLDDNSQIIKQNNPANIPTRGYFIDTIDYYSDIINRGKLSGELENQFRLLFGVSVMQSGDPKSAIAFLSNTQSKDSSAMLLKDMALAESHLKNEDRAAAKASYDRVLETHPNYWFALNNRAMLYYQEGDYDEALNTLERKLEEDPDNINALTARGAVRIKTRQLREAEDDLRRADRLSQEQKAAEQRPYIQKKLDLLEREKAVEQGRIKEANNQLRSGEGDNLETLANLAEANRNLGNYDQAASIADRIIEQDKDNPRALAVQLETAMVRNDKGVINKIQEEVQKLDTTVQRTIVEDRPILKRVLSTRIQ